MRIAKRCRRPVIAYIAIVLLAPACGGGSSEAASTASASTTTGPRSSPEAGSGTVADAKGDTLLSPPIGYLDAVSATVTKENGSFSFSFALASSIPRSFEVPSGWDALGWSFCIDTDPSVGSVGYPFGPGTFVPCEFIVLDLSRGGKLTGSLIDRRPLLRGGKAVTIPVSVTIRGPEVARSVPVRRLGNPDTFTWVMAATELTLPLGNDDFLDVDEVPDSSFEQPANWPPD